MEVLPGFLAARNSSMPWGLVALVRTEGLACLMALDQSEKKWLMAGWFC